MSFADEAERFHYEDYLTGKALYGRAGVLEYILVDPEGQYVERYLLKESTRFDRGEVLTLNPVLCLESLESVELPLWEMFGLEKPA